jgi:hypothetical protein
MNKVTKRTLAYIIGVALGDGNLSCPNGRATRLRISCDRKYPLLASEITEALKSLLPANRVSIVDIPNQGSFDISVYSNKLNDWMPWRVGSGSKAQQGARVPVWVKSDAIYAKDCLRGLIQTDGCIYTDRGYLMVNFVNNVKGLAEDARDMLVLLGFHPSFNSFALPNGNTKYTIKVARKDESQRLLDMLSLFKA